VKDTVLVIGGDLRQITVYNELKKEKFSVIKMALSDERVDLSLIKKADIVIFPMPVSCDAENLNAPFCKEKISLESIISKISEGAFVLGGKIPDDMEKILLKRKCKLADYLKREELAIKNAIATSEGAIEIALSEMPITIFESKALIVGYGRIGKILAKSLKGLGSNVTVSARKYADFAWIEEQGLKWIHTEKIDEISGNFDLIINTVPAEVINESVLKNVKDDTLILDLASKPGGVDFDTAKRLGKNVIWALSLPGKIAPITSGKIIKDTIMNILSETEV